ncbi:MAG: RNA methyltransferase [Pseudomonadota bacterium]
MPERIHLDHVTIILHQPRFPENIGAAARAIKNMGIRNLVVVSPKNCDLSTVLKMATHAAIDVVEEMDVSDDLKKALAPFHYVVGTTARLGGIRRSVQSPPAVARHLIPISQNNRIAILFGPEDKGLSNEEIRLCHSLVNIPTSEFSSINLAQAVMILCYELHAAGAERSEYVHRLASRWELDGMYEQVKDILVRINYINPENPDYWMDKIRHFFTRFQLRAREVSIIRGICRQIDWYGKKCAQDSAKKREVLL